MNSLSDTQDGSQTIYWKTPIRFWVLLAGLGIVILALFHSSLAYTVDIWLNREEYSHGLLIPAISAYLIWQKQQELIATPSAASWSGFVAVLGSLFLFFLGELTSLFILQQYALVLLIAAAACSILGTRLFKQIWAAVFFLLFAIPLPSFFFNRLSSDLQLWSSELGVFLIRLFGISVFQEGNVIDLGSMQLQVVEACSGLRYLFPLMSLAFMCAYFFQERFWKRALVFLSSIPITIFMNSFRIGMIGILVEYFGKSMAEGFLHDFEGWIIFMACTAILVIEMRILAMIGRNGRPLAEVFGLTIPPPLPSNLQFRERVLPRQYWAVLGTLAAATALSFALDKREEFAPPRQDFAAFPLKLGDWSGRRQSMEQKYVDELQFDDYILADYAKTAGAGASPTNPVNFYSAYYASQRKGASIHSPRSCIPGGGWVVESATTVSLDDIRVAGTPLRVNRLMIQKGEDRQLVYYWFQQRGRTLTDEYVVKWFLFWDALTRNRTDGALIRFITPSPRGENIAEAEVRLREMIRLAAADIENYVPN